MCCVTDKNPLFCNNKKQNLIDAQLQIQVDEYLNKWGDSYNFEERLWGDEKLDWEAALKKAWDSLLCNGKMHEHQRHCSKSLSEGLRVSREDNIQPNNFNNFHALYCWAELVANRVKGIGPVTAYDVARRLGVWIGLKPEMVYLHAGTAEGAKKLGVKGEKVSTAKGVKKLGRVAPLSEFPREIQELGATHAENFLCIYKDVIRAKVDEMP